jgi:hypothetical protein
MSHRAPGATESWTTNSGNWATSGNWNSGAGPVPGAGDYVYIATDDLPNHVVTYNYTGSVTLSSLTVDNDGEGTNTLSMTGSNALAATNEYFGDSNTSTQPGYGVMIQSAGSNAVSNNLTLGQGAQDEGVYNLSGTGSLTTTNNEYVGYLGTGSFTQSAGSNSVNGVLYLGYGSGSTGQYSLSGTGSLSVAGNESVAFGSAGTFTQSGGSNTVSSSLTIANNANGLYSLSASGVLSVAGNEFIGNGGGGTGTFRQSGGTNTVTGATNSEYVGYTSNGTYIQSGGVNNMANPAASLYVGNSTGVTGTYSLSGTGVLANANFEGIGGNGSGSFIQTGGTNEIYVSMLNIGAASGAVGYYSLSSGSLKVLQGGAEYVNSNGTFVQSGGLHQVGDSGDVTNLSIDGGGAYSLSGTGTLNVTGAEYVGTGGTSGTFNQSAGTNTLGGGPGFTYPESVLCIAANSGSVGSYSLSGTGALTVSTDPGSGLYVGGSYNASGGKGVLTVSGGQITVNGTLEVWNSSGTQVTISGGTVSAGNTVNLATINVTGGSANLGAVTGTGTLNVGDASATVTASGLQQSSVTITSTGQLTLTAGGATNAVNSLVIDSGGVLDLTSTKLIINYGGGPDPISTIAGYIKSGYNGGGWNGSGIISTTAQTHTNGLSYGVGYADGNDGNVSGLSSGQIEVMYTLLGDANLDGIVNAADFTILAANFNQTVTGWDQGDFNYDGIVNAADFTDLAANFNQGVSGATSAGDVAALDAFAAANGISLASVPEPASLGLLFFGAMGILARRHRRD